jgi:S-adenosylmethionine decarboxylase proenzyme
MEALGIHLLADLYECDSSVLNDVSAIRHHMIEAAKRCGATIVSECFHQFSPQGASGVVVIAESHMAIHTWPEHRFAAVELFTCGERLNPEDAFAYLREVFKCERHTTTKLQRGRQLLER